MADFRLDLPRMANGEPDIDVWLDEASGFSSASRKTAVAVFDLIAGHESRKPGLELVELLLQLKMDIVTVMAGMAFFAVQRGDVDTHKLPEKVAGLIAAVLRLSNTNVLAFNDSAVLSSEAKSQTDNVRHLLIALIDDPRVAVVKLAERIVALRHVKDGDRTMRHIAAREAMEFFAPLAGRLGIRQLKWLLEDMAFHYLYPKEYRQIVAKLDGRREERERQVEAIRQDLEFRLSAANIEAEVHGRAKHIYSIWEKMNHKDIDFSEVHDVQAVRVLVDQVDACYRVMGVVHTSWPHVPSEFDDYIANPKENGYRAIHTAVVGPAGKTLEVQIRTREMHEEAELGVCAHWAYKDEAGTAFAGALQSQKMDWLRSVLEWHEERHRRGDQALLFGPANGMGTAHDSVFAARERIFVTTPQGHVLDLAPNATAVDFAYRVHTEIGHRCISARVDGHRVPLNRRLATGECVEIETGQTAQPRREWLDPALGYVNTSRARSKIQSWFRGQVEESNISAGRKLLMEALAQIPSAESPAVADASAGNFTALARLADYNSEDELLLAVGVGDQLAVDLAKLLTRSTEQGAMFASPQEADDRREETTGQSFCLTVRGHDRDGLLRDVMTAVAAESISVVAANARTHRHDQSATISMQILIADLNPNPPQLLRAEADIRAIADVVDIHRTAA